MKKLYIKEKLLSFVDHFTVKNENEEDCYVVQGDRVQIGGKKLHIFDMNEREQLMIQQKILALMPKFFVYKGDEQVAMIQKKMSFLGSKYIVEGPGWEVKGKVMGHDYTMTKDGKEIVSLHKAWLSWGDSYEMDIADDVDEVLALAVVLAIEMVIQQEETNASASVGTD